MPMTVEVLDNNLDTLLITNCVHFEVTSNSQNPSQNGVYIEFNTETGSDVFKSVIQYLNTEERGCNLILTSPNLDKKLLVSGATFHHETNNDSFGNTIIETLRYLRYTVVPSNMTLTHTREVFFSMIALQSEFNSNYISESFKCILNKALEEYNAANYYI